MTTKQFCDYTKTATQIVALTGSGHNVTVSRNEAISWMVRSERGRVGFQAATNTLWIGLQYWDGEPIEDPQPSPGPSDPPPES